MEKKKNGKRRQKSLEAVKSDIIFYWREEKWTNKGNDKQEEVDSLLHNTTEAPPWHGQ